MQICTDELRGTNAAGLSSLYTADRFCQRGISAAATPQAALHLDLITLILYELRFKSRFID